MKVLSAVVRAGVSLLVIGPIFQFAQAQVTNDELATEHLASGGIHWQIHVEFDSVVLVVAGPGGEILHKEFESNPSFSLAGIEGGAPSDGSIFLRSKHHLYRIAEDN